MSTYFNCPHHHIDISNLCYLPHSSLKLKLFLPKLSHPPPIPFPPLFKFSSPLVFPFHLFLHPFPPPLYPPFLPCPLVSFLPPSLFFPPMPHPLFLPPYPTPSLYLTLFSFLLLHLQFNMFSFVLSLFVFYFFLQP